MKKYNFENFSITHFSSGTLSLDGGAMFGVVPKKLWNRVYPCDESNRITLGMNLLLIKGAQGNILVDTGCLGIKNQKLKKIYKIENKDPFKNLDINENDINHVILTHLHFDHTGGSTIFDGKEWVPRFKNATYWIGKKEWERATDPNERESGSYYPETFLPILEKGNVEFVEGDKEILQNIFFIEAPGHTPGHRIVKIQDEKMTLYYLADLIPTTKHIPIPWIMAYDLEPLLTLKTRKKLYKEFLKKDTRVFFEHDEHPTSGFIKQEGEMFVFCE